METESEKMAFSYNVTAESTSEPIEFNSHYLQIKKLGSGIREDLSCVYNTRAHTRCRIRRLITRLRSSVHHHALHTPDHT